MAGVITWISVGGAVGYATCGRTQDMPSMLIAEVLVGAAGGFVGGGLAALFWNRASTRLELFGVMLAAVTAAAVAFWVQRVTFREPGPN